MPCWKQSFTATPLPRTSGSWGSHNLAGSNHVAEHGIAQLRLEPGAFGRHDSAGIGDGHKVFDACGEHGKGAGVIAVIDYLFQLRRPANAADEVDALAGARVINAEKGSERIFLKQSDIKLFN